MTTVNPSIDALAEAYRATTYLIEAAGGTIPLRIGERAADLDRLLASSGASGWAIVTPENPDSRIVPIEANERAWARFRADVEEGGWHGMPTVARGDDGLWPPERGLLLLGISRDAALELGRRHGQVAIVAGVRGGAPELLFCAPRTGD